MSANGSDTPPAKVVPPKMRQDLDLTQPPKQIPHANTPQRDKTNVLFKSPEDMMVEMGFDPETGNLTPLQFMLAVMNDDVDKIYRQKKKREMMRTKGIGMNYRLDAAKTSSRYMHMAQPQLTVGSRDEDDFHRKLEDNIREGNDRYIRKQMIIETVERVSPDMPLQDASYPPVFSEGGTQENGSTQAFDASQVMKGDTLIIEQEPLPPAEGNMDYNPDEHD